jgi:hypothetical protein
MIVGCRGATGSSFPAIASARRLPGPAESEVDTARIQRVDGTERLHHRRGGVMADLHCRRTYSNLIGSRAKIL